MIIQYLCERLRLYNTTRTLDHEPIIRFYFQCLSRNEGDDANYYRKSRFFVTIMRHIAVTGY